MKHQWEYKARTESHGCKIAWCARCGCIQDGDDIVAPFGTDGDGAGVILCTPATAMSIPDRPIRSKK